MKFLSILILNHKNLNIFLRNFYFISCNLIKSPPSKYLHYNRKFTRLYCENKRLKSAFKKVNRIVMRFHDALTVKHYRDVP